MKAGAIPKKIWSAKQPPLHFMEMAVRWKATRWR
jgi:hypothetical protein